MTEPQIVGWAHTRFGKSEAKDTMALMADCLLYTSPSPRD